MHFEVLLRLLRYVLHTPTEGELACLLKRYLFLVSHGAFLGTFRFVGFYKKVLYTTV